MKGNIPARQQQRHHSAHPPSKVLANPNINKHSHPAPPERAAINVNPSLPGPVGVDAVNARKQTPEFNSKRDHRHDVSDPSLETHDPDDPDYDPELDDSE
jgi:hypothetical protein